jgi:pimeloyl-ACP methyl ester carboxylesterase
VTVLVRAVGLVGSGTKATVPLPTQGKVNEVGITLRRGYNVLAVDGPGQGGALHLQKLVMRPDWEAVITPVVDYALARREIEPGRIAGFGYSLGGYLLARAAAFEHRLSALVLDDGVHDLASGFAENMPPFLGPGCRTGTTSMRSR